MIHFIIITLMMLQTPPLTDVVLAWDAVTTNVDDTPCTDLMGYMVYAEPFTLVAPLTPSSTAIRKTVLPSAAPEVSVMDLVRSREAYAHPFTSMRFWVDAYDTSGNHSEVSAFVDVEIPPDVTPPQPASGLRVKKM